MRLHILGVCGTFMAGIAQIARQLGHEVSGSDDNCYPPMDQVLADSGIQFQQGYRTEHLKPSPDLVIMGNAMKRGDLAVEYVLDRGIPYCSGPEWLAKEVLNQRWVLAVSGTHGKTTTSSMLTWILQEAGYQPGYLIAGVAENLPHTADTGGSDFFVIEADEYDTAFFDKRSKFVHYRPRTLLINNLEFDHADIFANLAAIQKQFHHCVRTVPSIGQVLYPEADENIQAVLQQGCWSERLAFSGGSDWQAIPLDDRYNAFAITEQKNVLAECHWSLLGEHNQQNALAAILAARHVGVSVPQAVKSLEKFQGVKRRLQLVGNIDSVIIYDDFAHHPTAIRTTLKGLRAQAPNKQLIAVLQCGSYTMRTGIHGAAIDEACSLADESFCLVAGEMQQQSAVFSHAKVMQNSEQLYATLCEKQYKNAQIVFMSNSDFAQLPNRYYEYRQHAAE